MAAFRTTLIYTDFIKQWNLQIYFTLRYVGFALEEPVFTLLLLLKVLINAC